MIYYNCEIIGQHRRRRGRQQSTQRIYILHNSTSHMVLFIAINQANILIMNCPYAMQMKTYNFLNECLWIEKQTNLRKYYSNCVVCGPLLIINRWRKSLCMCVWVSQRVSIIDLSFGFCDRRVATLLPLYNHRLLFVHYHFFCTNFHFGVAFATIFCYFACFDVVLRLPWAKERRNEMRKKCLRYHRKYFVTAFAAG